MTTRRPNPSDRTVEVHVDEIHLHLPAALAELSQQLGDPSAALAAAVAANTPAEG